MTMMTTELQNRPAATVCTATSIIKQKLSDSRHW